MDFDIFEVKIDWKKIFFIENDKFVQKSMVFPIKNRIFALEFYNYERKEIYNTRA